MHLFSQLLSARLENFSQAEHRFLAHNGLQLSQNSAFRLENRDKNGEFKPTLRLKAVKIGEIYRQKRIF